MGRYTNVGRRAAALLGSLFLAACGSDGPSAPTTGAIAVTSSALTTSDNAAFEYSIAIDNGAPRAVSSSTAASYVVPGLSIGSHTVTIRGLAPGCTAGTETRTVGVVGGDTVDVAFTVVCTRTTGDLSVSAATTGAELDADGYNVTVDGTVRGTLGVNGTGAVGALTPGSHVVGLTGLASNCTTTTATQNVIITAGATSLARFDVVCRARTGTLRFVTTTTGAELDPNGYVVVVDGNTVFRVPTNGTFRLSNVPLGRRVVFVREVANNCAVTMSPDFAVTAVEDTVAVPISVACLARGSGTIGFTVTDPASDTLPNEDADPDPSIDLRSTVGRYSPGFLTLTLRFAAPVVSGIRDVPNSMYAAVQFDTDENPGTGTRPLSNDFGGNATQGVEVSVFIDDDSTQAPIFRGSALAGTAGLRFLGDSVILTIPLSVLGDDGDMSMTLLVGTRFRATDIGPNTGVILTRRPVGSAPDPSWRQTAPVPAAGGRPGAIEAIAVPQPRRWRR